MAGDKFDLVFRGELVPGADLAQVKQNLSRLFKMEPARVELLFAGKPVVLKRGMDMDAAGKYRIALKKAGARVDTVASQVAAKAAAKKEPAPARSSSQVGSSESKPAPVAQPAVTASTVGLSLAPVGGDLLAPNEKRPQDAVPVDTSSLSLRPVGESLLDDSERDVPVPLPLDLDGLDLAPAGADVLKPEERKKVVEADIDLSALSVAPPGDRLEAPKAPPPPAPDTSGISLAENK